MEIAYKCTCVLMGNISKVGYKDMYDILCVFDYVLCKKLSPTPAETIIFHKERPTTLSRNLISS